jgi:hypothetical protein
MRSAIPDIPESDVTRAGLDLDLGELLLSKGRSKKPDV